MHFTEETGTKMKEFFHNQPQCPCFELLLKPLFPRNIFISSLLSKFSSASFSFSFSYFYHLIFSLDFLIPLSLMSHNTSLVCHGLSCLTEGSLNTSDAVLKIKCMGDSIFHFYSLAPIWICWIHVLWLIRNWSKYQLKSDKILFHKRHRKDMKK